MIKNEYDELKELVFAECNVPDSFFLKAGEHEKYCYFLASNESCSFLFIDSCYKSFTGYLPKEHQKGGLDFWFSKVHPDDRTMLSDRIIESLKPELSSFNREQPEPKILNYRFKKGTGEWIWMQHTVYNLSFDAAGKVDKVLHRLRLLDVLTQAAGTSEKTHEVLLRNGSAVSKLTSRERQILKLIAEGLSTKMISHRLKISINTVETHRRHLLEKLDAKNSMELIRKTFRLFWN